MKNDVDLSILKESHFRKGKPESYKDIWKINGRNDTPILQDDIFDENHVNNSWSKETEEIHEEPTKNGWIDVYEREKVINTVGKIVDNNKLIVEFGASAGYMIDELKSSFPNNRFIATDLMNEGLLQSFKRNPDIMHIRCDFTDAPFEDETIDFIYSLNVLEHIEDDKKAISECFRVLKTGGHCLFVVPRGNKLYDYFDEVMFHKRRYAREELKQKCKGAGFSIEEDFHFAWTCYPLFWIKKKWNRHVGKRLSREDKIERVKKDVDDAMSSPLAIKLMHFEQLLSKRINPSYGVREFILCTKASRQ